MTPTSIAQPRPTGKCNVRALETAFVQWTASGTASAVRTHKRAMTPESTEHVAAGEEETPACRMHTVVGGLPNDLPSCVDRPKEAAACAQCRVSAEQCAPSNARLRLRGTAHGQRTDRTASCPRGFGQRDGGQARIGSAKPGGGGPQVVERCARASV